MNQDEELYGTIYEKGEVVCTQGDAGDSMFVIQYGAVEVSQVQQGNIVVLALLETGDFFGEMALIDSRPRSATVRTLSRCRLLAITRDSLLKRLNSDPSLALHLLGKVCLRIEESNRLISVHEDEPGGSTSSDSFSADDIDKDPLPSITHDESISSSDNLLQKELINKLTALIGEQGILSFKSGGTIFNEGDVDDSMYFIVDGMVEISKKIRRHTYVLANLFKDDFFGEMSLIRLQPRTASAAAIESTSLVRLKRHEFLEGLRKRPELALIVLQLMILRLRNTLQTLGSEKVKTHGSMHKPALILKNKKKMNINMISLSACSGCVLGLLQQESDLSSVLQMADISYSPMLMDQEKIGFADIAIVDGAVRVKEEEELLREVRDKCRYLVAWGTCASFGGVPALANTFEVEELIEESYGHAFDPFTYYLSGSMGLQKSSYQDTNIKMLRKVKKVDDIVKIDYYLPGCPPQTDLLTSLIREMSGLRETSGIKKIVCSDCSRKPFKCSRDYSIALPGPAQKSEQCFNAGGTICLGFITRGGCHAVCPGGGLPCWGCRGPTDSLLKKMAEGENLESILIHRLEHHCKASGEQVRKLINIITNRGNSLLRFDHYFIHDRNRLR